MILCDYNNQFEKGKLPRDVEYNAVKARAGSDSSDFILSFQSTTNFRDNNYNLKVLRGGFSLQSLVLLNKLGSLILLLLSLFIVYGLLNGEGFSVFGGFMLLVVSITFSTIFWLYAIKLKESESRC